MAKKELREDIKRAKERAGGTFMTNGDLRKIEANLWENETVEYLASGNYSGGQGILALTDRRLFFYVSTFGKEITEDFPFDKISSIQWSSGFVTGTITAYVSNNKAEITKVPKESGKTFVDAVRHQISNSGIAGTHAAAPTMPAQAPVKDDVFEQLEKLGKLRDKGVVTEAEFETKKAELLRRL